MTKPYLEVKIVRQDRIRKITLHQALMTADYRATLATGLLPSFSHVGVPDGETSKGEQRMRPRTAKELADFTVELTELMVSAFEQRGWLVEVPSIDTLMDDDGTSVGFGGKP